MAASHGRNELKFADWMATLPESIHSIPLTNLAIPGRRAGAADRALGTRAPAPPCSIRRRAGTCHDARRTDTGLGVRVGGLGPGGRRLRASGLLAFPPPLGTVARSQGDCFPRAFEAACARALGRGPARLEDAA